MTAMTQYFSPAFAAEVFALIEDLDLVLTGNEETSCAYDIH